MPLVIPIFIPHEGCPHCCVFCNQHRISGQAAPPASAVEVGKSIEQWLAQSRLPADGQVQVAFYGGSFTGLPRSRQETLLGAVQPFLDQGRVHSIRLSTRPDYIDSLRLGLLRRHRVATIELGVQSCDQDVLLRAERGYTPAAVTRAVALIKDQGFSLGIQLMLGLPGERFAALRRTCREVIAMHPDFVRLYPALVLQGSTLADWFHQGDYRPLSLEKAVLQAVYLKKRFDEQGIQMVRMGLQPGPELEAALVAGPYHPSFGHLVHSRLMFKNIRRIVATWQGPQPVRLVISPKDLSVFQGHGKCNLVRLAQLGLTERFTLVLDSAQPRQCLGVIAPENRS